VIDQGERADPGLQQAGRPGRGSVSATGRGRRRDTGQVRHDVMIAEAGPLASPSSACDDVELAESASDG